MTLENIKIVGTSHIAPESLKEVEDTIVEFQPDFVAIELDKKRLHALMNKDRAKGPGIRDVKKLGVKGWLFGSLGGWVERSLGKKVGVSPGDEMLRAVGAAMKVKAHLVLIDRDIAITLKRFGKQLTWREKWRFLGDIVKGLFGFSSLKFDVSKVPSKKVIDMLLAEVQQRYPSVYKVLIEERNEFMAKALTTLLKRYPDSKVVVVVGAGHEKGLKHLLKKYLNE